MKNTKQQVEELYKVAQEYADKNDCICVISIAYKNKDYVLASVLFADDIDINTGQHIGGRNSCMGGIQTVLHTIKVISTPSN